MEDFGRVAKKITILRRCFVGQQVGYVFVVSFNGVFGNVFLCEISE